MFVYICAALLVSQALDMAHCIFRRPDADLYIFMAVCAALSAHHFCECNYDGIRHELSSKSHVLRGWGILSVVMISWIPQLKLLTPLIFVAIGLDAKHETNHRISQKRMVTTFLVCVNLVWIYKILFTNWLRTQLGREQLHPLVHSLMSIAGIPMELEGVWIYIVYSAYHSMIAFLTTHKNLVKPCACVACITYTMYDTCRCEYTCFPATVGMEHVFLPAMFVFPIMGLSLGDNGTNKISCNDTIILLLLAAARYTAFANDFVKRLTDIVLVYGISTAILQFKIHRLYLIVEYVGSQWEIFLAAYIFTVNIFTTVTAWTPFIVICVACIFLRNNRILNWTGVVLAILSVAATSMHNPQISLPPPIYYHVFPPPPPLLQRSLHTITQNMGVSLSARNGRGANHVATYNSGAPRPSLLPRHISPPPPRRYMHTSSPPPPRRYMHTSSPPPPRRYMHTSSPPPLRRYMHTSSPPPPFSRTLLRSVN
jgi:hypothetical protein